MSPADSPPEQTLLRDWHLELDYGRLGASSEWHRYWSIMDIYLSPVALAAHLQAAGEWPEREKDEAKNALKRLLVQIDLCTREAGYVLPVVGVVEVNEEQRELLHEWERDQDWHRGQFLLFNAVTRQETEGRLLDILGPEPPRLPREEFKPRTTKDVMEKLQQSENVTGELFQTLRVAQQAFETVAYEPLDDGTEEERQRRRQRAERAVEEPFRRWVAQRLGEPVSWDAGQPSRLSPKEQLSPPIVVPSDRTNEGERYVRRVTGLQVRNFRGFIWPSDNPPKMWRTDGDVVLLAGPNGNGKTSFLEALLLVLTGYHLREDSRSPGSTTQPPESLFSLVLPAWSDVSPNGQQSTRAESFTIKATVQMTNATIAESGDGSITVEAHRSDEKLALVNSWNGPWPLSVTRHWTPSFWEDEEDSELDARLCGFFQEHVARAYDENVRGRTIRDVFEPNPLFFRIVGKVIETIHTDLADRSNSEMQRASRYPDEQIKAIEERMQRWTADFIALYAQFQKRRPDWPVPPASGNIPQALIQLCRDILARGGQTSSGGEPILIGNVLQLLRYTHRQLLREARRAHPGQAARYGEVEEIETALDRIGQTFPHLDDELTWFVVKDDAGTQRTSQSRTLATLLRDLEGSVPRWLAHAKQVAASTDRLHKLALELEAVQTTAAGERAEELEAWIQPRREAAERRDMLKKRLEDLRRQLRDFVPPQELEMYRRTIDDLEQRLSAVRDFYFLQQWKADMEQQGEWLAQLSQMRQELEGFAQAIEDELQPSEPLRQALQTAVNAVLGRFAMSQGLEQIVLQGAETPEGRQLFRPLGAQSDGRSFQEFSTGQRSQVAVALMIAQYEMAQQQALPGHRVLILDDVSTSYDLSNLSREALLWRQLAYHPDERYRRQVFIASHHEDLTHHLIDLLAPPGHGKYPGTMRLLKFDGWDRHTGPEIREYNVQRAPASDENGLHSHKLADFLEESL